MFGALFLDMTKLFKTIREAGFSSGMGCVHYSSTSVKHNSKYRCLCKDYAKSFNGETAHKTVT